MTTPLNEFIREHYGSQKKLAETIGVAEQTIVRWVRREPEYLMRHAFDLSAGMEKSSRSKFIKRMAMAIIEHMEIHGQKTE